MTVVGEESPAEYTRCGPEQEPGQRRSGENRRRLVERTQDRRQEILHGNQGRGEEEEITETQHDRRREERAQIQLHARPRRRGGTRLSPKRVTMPPEKKPNREPKHRRAGKRSPPPERNGQHNHKGGRKRPAQVTA